jgi:single-strand DNA-binding protein
MSSRSLNRVILIGNLTRDPELKYTPQGTAVCTFGIATNRSWTTQTGETKEDVQFHRLVAWQKLAELCSKILTKGKKVYVEGRITYRNFTGKDGTQKSITEIVLDDFVLFDSAKKADDGTTPKEVDHESHETNDKADDTIMSDTNDMDEKVDPDDIPF